jgi:hypothetical protein
MFQVAIIRNAEVPSVKRDDRHTVSRSPTWDSSNSPTEAALVQLKNEQRLASPIIGGATEKFTGLGSKILALMGHQHVASIADLFSALIGLAASKDEANLIYFGEVRATELSNAVPNCISNRNRYPFPSFLSVAHKLLLYLAGLDFLIGF